VNPFWGRVAQGGFHRCSLDFIWDIDFWTSLPYKTQVLPVSQSELITLLGSMHSKGMSWRAHFRLFRFPVRCPDNPHAVASGATEGYSSSSSKKVLASGLWLACREVSAPASSTTAATLGFLGFGWFDLPPGNLNDFLWMVLTLISFWQCFHPWLVRVHLVHCPLAFLSSTGFLVDTGVCFGPNSMPNFLPGCRLPFLYLFLLFPRLVYPFLFSCILRFFRCLCHSWLVTFPFPTWIRHREIIVLKPFSFLEIVFLADRLSKNFYLISVVGVFLMNRHSPYSLLLYLVSD